MTEPKTVFVGKVYDKKANPEDERKVITFDKSEKREDGTWKNIKAVGIVYSDDSVVTLGEHLVLKPHHGDKGNQTHNIYYTVFPEGSEYKPSEYKPSDSPEGGKDGIPF